MRKNPSDKALLAIADTTEAALTANLDDPQARYKQAMIRNARAIAERQSEAAPSPEELEHSDLISLLGQEGEVQDLNHRLVALIRSKAAPAGAHRHLVTAVRRELAESNPAYLAKVDTQVESLGNT